MSERTSKAIKECGEWMAYCVRIGWPKSSLDGLQALWWEYHDEQGNIRALPIGATSTPQQAAAEEQDETQQDTRRLDWLAAHLHSADFDYPHTDTKCALIIEWPRNVTVGASLRANIDTAISKST